VNSALLAIDRALASVLRACAVLVLPLSLLLFLQWPLREWVQRYSREANDLGQILFAFYASLAITACTREREHLATDALAHAFSSRARARLSRLASLVVVVPWSAFVIYAATPSIVQSVRARELFPDTFNPGYFLVKLALAALALAALAQAIIDVFARRDVRDA